MKVMTLVQAAVVLTLAFCALDELEDKKSDKQRDPDGLQKKGQRLVKFILKNLLFSILITGGIGLLFYLSDNTIIRIMKWIQNIGIIVGVICVIAGGVISVTTKDYMERKRYVRLTLIVFVMMVCFLVVRKIVAGNILLPRL